MNTLSDFLLPFKNFITTQGLFNPNEKVLLAVSGGVDSVMMARLFEAAHFNFGIAHCNFQLRGADADTDSAFVSQLAQELGVAYHQVKFNTLAFAEGRKISIQMAARELRYSWLREIKKEYGYDYIAVGHHKSDTVETVMINMLRGTGLAGLHGILAKRDDIIRPLLFLTRDEIESMANMCSVNFREDLSNRSSKYVRNKLRNEVIPILKEINPDLERSFSQTIEYVKESEELVNLYLDEKRELLFKFQKDEILIDIEKLQHEKQLHGLLYGLLRPYGFLSSTVTEIIGAFDAQPGKQFYSPSHKILKDRTELILTSLSTETEPLSIERLFNARVETNKSFGIPFSNQIGCFDYDKLKFPLEVRNWQAGDAFTPLGMKSKKKLSDFLIDLKIPLNEKEKVKVVLSGTDIIWVAGYRINDRYKITPNTQKVYILAMKE
ncbi:tRNA lysidine(34) synthetase TilS [Solitalea sp. MAHUQ-68]|uniref:tRNA(Ile)-lysidine synthase n=1 Tax=Solitalea agri TaxID=2953739 RepID=A0A9X2JCK7_9SPHI|nr:tRNA lysidine(34) synthetase TilS [Solitalea agri]MCO4293572.1 tRNA lysidine(34) synthetase TilS [Solitalea agri]